MKQLRSMTAFASAETRVDGWHLSWELRSVNHRFLEISFRIPDAMRFQEQEYRTCIQASLKRGKLDATLNIKRMHVQDAGPKMDRELLQTLLNLTREIDELSGQTLSRHSALDLLAWPGVLQGEEMDRSALADISLQVLNDALTGQVRSRETEGQQLSLLIEQRCEKMGEWIRRVQERMPQVQENIRQKILARLAEINAKPDVERLEQEMVYLAQKLDVAEEMDRLSSHLEEVRRTLNSQEPAGRRLDFLIQELNREANTLGSKSADSETSKISVEMKVLIEQMREQIQNIE